MWCPLVLLLVPTALSFWTSKRKSTLIIKIKEVLSSYNQLLGNNKMILIYYAQFESGLKKTLYEFNTNDSTHHINWSLERVPIEQAPKCCSRSAVIFCLMINITEIDPELGIIGGEELPTYQQVATNTAYNMVSQNSPPPSYELTALATIASSIVRPPEPLIIAR